MAMQQQTCPVQGGSPEEGDVYVCRLCKFTVTVLRGCSCDDERCVALACCGEAMVKAN
jgi:hypothetical protein